MDIGIIGLPQSGKTTLFLALAGRKTQASDVGVSKIEDHRLQGLVRLFQPKRVVPLELRYTDFALPPTFGKGEGFGGSQLNRLTTMDALLHIVRAFSDEAVPHIQGSVDPDRDVEMMNLELAFSDLSIIEHRLQRLIPSIKGAKPAERESLLREQSLLQRVKDKLEEEIPLREQSLSPEDKKLLENFRFLTAKPILLVFNLGEAELPRAGDLLREWVRRHSKPSVDCLALCAKLELELAEMEAAEAESFRQSYGLGEGIRAVPRLSFSLLGLISFFTFVSEEARAWAVPRDTPAVKAAGKIHSDMERGFIRAEVIGYENLMRCGSLAEARRQGLLRAEGKTYPVQDGDVITFLFNV